MNIYRPFVLRVLTGEAEVLDHEQMKPCNQSVIQAAVKVKGCTLHAFKRHTLPCPQPFIYAGQLHGPLQEQIRLLLPTGFQRDVLIIVRHVIMASFPLKLWELTIGIWSLSHWPKNSSVSVATGKLCILHFHCCVSADIIAEIMLVKVNSIQGSRQLLLANKRFHLCQRRRRGQQCFLANSIRPKIMDCTYTVPQSTFSLAIHEPMPTHPYINESLLPCIGTTGSSYKLSVLPKDTSTYGWLELRLEPATL